MIIIGDQLKSRKNRQEKEPVIVVEKVIMLQSVMPRNILMGII